MGCCNLLLGIANNNLSLKLLREVSLGYSVVFGSEDVNILVDEIHGGGVGRAMLRCCLDGVEFT